MKAIAETEAEAQAKTEAEELPAVTTTIEEPQELPAEVAAAVTQQTLAPPSTSSQERVRYLKEEERESMIRACYGIGGTLAIRAFKEMKNTNNYSSDEWRWFAMGLDLLGCTFLALNENLKPMCENCSKKCTMIEDVSKLLYTLDVIFKGHGIIVTSMLNKIEQAHKNGSVEIGAGSSPGDHGKRIEGIDDCFSMNVTYFKNLWEIGGREAEEDDEEKTGSNSTGDPGSSGTDGGEGGGDTDSGPYTI